jgi:tRNA A-37 threonylcarbamoyl transferase component Bud32
VETALDYLEPGTTLQQYRIVKVLGSGGFSVVYLAQDQMLEKLFAIKEYFPERFAQRSRASVRANASSADDFIWGKERFKEEAQVVGRFDHPNIVQVIQIFEANNTAYMVLEYLPGRDFKAWLDEIDGPPSQAELDAMVGPILDALEVIHHNDLLHRDVAPDNIYIRNDSTPVLLDFGSAKEAIGQRTRTVSAVVKEGYSPAEQYSTRGSGQGPWTDIYALAATLYHAVSGARPEASTERLLDDQYVSAHQAAKATYRKGFLDSIDWALKLAPSERPRSIAEWRVALIADAGAHRQTRTGAAHDFTARQPQPPGPGGGTEAARNPGKPKTPFPVLNWGLAAVVVLIVAVALVSRHERDRFEMADKDGGKLAEYVNSCWICAFREVARAEIEKQGRPAKPDGGNQIGRVSKPALADRPQDKQAKADRAPSGTGGPFIPVPAPAVPSVWPTQPTSPVSIPPADPDPVPTPRRSVWDHNGSVVLLKSSGADRAFYYDVPRPEMSANGVTAGTLLFKGRRDGNIYSGTAYVFSKSCAAVPYAVKGPVSPGQTQVTMYGKAPQLDADCRTHGYRDDTLVFTFNEQAKLE